MKSPFLQIAAILVLGSSVLPARAQLLPSQAKGPARSQIVMLSVNGGCAAGIIVGYDEKTVYIATAAHITDLSTKLLPDVAVRFEGLSKPPSAGKFWPQFKEKDKGDLAVVTVGRDDSINKFLDELDFALLSPVPLGPADTPVTSIGCSGGSWWSSGSNETLLTPEPDQGYLRFQSDVSQGQSGGGLYNEGWELIGMPLDKGDNWIYARPIAQILEELRKWGVPIRLSPRPLKVRVRGADEVARESKARELEAKGRELATASAESIGQDPERSVLLGMYAVNATLQSGKPPVREAEDALHEAISSSYVRKTFNGIQGKVAYSPDGQRIAAASFNVEISDVIGQRIVAVSSGHTAEVWDVVGGRKLLSLQGHLDGVEDVVFSLDGKRIATASKDRTAKIWDAVSGQELLTLRGHLERVVGVAFSPDSKRIATCSEDRTAKIWDAISGRDLLTLRGHTQGVSGLVYSPDGKRLATASNDQTIRVWDAVGGKLLLTLHSHSSGFIRVAFSSDGKRLASGGFDNTVRVWDGSDGHQLLSVSEPGLVESVAFSPDGKLLANTSGQTVNIRDSGNGRVLLTLRGHSREVTSVAFSPDAPQGQRLATASVDGTVRIWDLSGQEFSNLGDVQFMSAAVFSPDGRRVVTVDHLDTDAKARVWDTVSGQELFSLRSAAGNIYGVIFSPDGQRVASFGSDAILWDAVDGRELLTLQDHLDVVDDIAFSPDGKRVATASNDHTAKVWDSSTGQELLTLRGHSTLVRGVAFNPDGKRIATASDDQTAKVWDSSTGQELLTLRGHSTPVRGVAFSPDGKRIATVSDDTTKIWDSASGEELLTLAATGLIAFSPDGKRLAMVGPSLKMWDSYTGEELLSLSGAGMRRRINEAEQLDPSDLFTGFDSSGPTPAGVRKPEDITPGVAFSRDGKRLAIVSTDGAVLIYAVDVRDLLALARGRVTRGLTPDECKQYLQTDKCPPLP